MSSSQRLEGRDSGAGGGWAEGIGVVALLLEARNVTLERLKLVVEFLLLWRDLEIIWL